PCEINDQYLSRFVMDGDSIILESERVLLKVGVQRETCCHSGGSITFDGEGNLYLSTGDNTSSKESDGFSPLDERPGRGPFDAQKSSGNTWDLRGKVLRIKPVPTANYVIPAGNLFPMDGTNKGRPEIYAMGARNPFRISVDKKTGFVYWGDVGPDVGADGRYGPQSYDEWNQARKPGFFGWPYFIGNNRAYPDRDFDMDTLGPVFDAAHPVNLSPNNTGSRDLPPAQSAFIYYAKSKSTVFPRLTQGSNSAMAGPVYYIPETATDSKVKFPAYFEGKLFIYEWARSWINLVTMKENGDLEKIEPFLTSEEWVKPIEMEFGPDGAMYMLEYGKNYFMNNPKARLSKIEFAEGNRLPTPSMSVDMREGAVPHTVQFSAGGSFDNDEGDSLLMYQWFFTEENTPQAEGENAQFTFETPGTYKVKLAVIDPQGGISTTETQIRAGNAPPAIEIEYAGNRSFFLDKKAKAYNISITDKEDGTIASARTKVNFIYVDDGNDLEVFLGDNAPSGNARYVKGYNLIQGSDCWSCHGINEKNVGPSYMEVSKKYQKDPEAVGYLSEKIIQGGNGVWGEKIMAGHPQHSLDETVEMARYILSLTDSRSSGKMPLAGNLSTDQHLEAKGAYLFSVTYTDEGANGIPALTQRETLVLHAPVLKAEKADIVVGCEPLSDGKKRDMTVMSQGGHGTYFGFQQIDLTDVSSLNVSVKGIRGGSLSLRKGAPDGKEIGRISAPACNPGLNWEGHMVLPYISTKMPIQKTSGLHDIYFVFDSPTSKGEVMRVYEIGFSAD
ncbi:PQQ-dependent sugar dehydrogenase, partial [bacterium]|nr:PQQ-dependent sugar dehydrogenase [bacterium]